MMLMKYRLYNSKGDTKMHCANLWWTLTVECGIDFYVNWRFYINAVMLSFLRMRSYLQSVFFVELSKFLHCVQA